MPLGPFNNIYGMGASPVIVGDLVVLACDQSLGLVHDGGRQAHGQGAVEGRSARGEERPLDAHPLEADRTARIRSSLPGSFLLTAYDAATGKKLWWVGGLSFEMKSTPVIGGDTIYVNGYGAPVNDPGNKIIDPRRRRGVEDGGCRRQRRDLESRVSEVHAGLLVRRRRSRSQRLADARTSGRTTAPRSIPRTACSPFALAVRAT